MPMTSMVDRLIRVAEFCPYVLGRPYSAMKKDSTGQSLCDVERESLVFSTCFGMNPLVPGALNTFAPEIWLIALGLMK